MPIISVKIHDFAKEMLSLLGGNREYTPKEPQDLVDILAVARILCIVLDSEATKSRRMKHKFEWERIYQYDSTIPEYSLYQEWANYHPLLFL